MTSLTIELNDDHSALWCSMRILQVKKHSNDSKIILLSNPYYYMTAKVTQQDKDLMIQSLLDRWITQETIQAEMLNWGKVEYFGIRRKSDNEVFKSLLSFSYQTRDLDGNDLWRNYRFVKPNVYEDRETKELIVQKTTNEKGKQSWWLYDKENFSFEKPIYIVEWDMDYMTARSYWMNVLWIIWVGTLRNRLAELQRYSPKDKIILLTDNDESWRERAIRSMVSLLNKQIDLHIWSLTHILPTQDNEWNEMNDFNDLHKLHKFQIPQELFEQVVDWTKEYMEETFANMNISEAKKFGIDIQSTDKLKWYISEYYADNKVCDIIMKNMNEQFTYWNFSIVPIEVNYHYVNDELPEQLTTNSIRCLLFFDFKPWYEIIEMTKQDYRNARDYKEFMDSYIWYQFNLDDNKPTIHQHRNVFEDLLNQLYRIKALLPSSIYSHFWFVKGKENKLLRCSNGFVDFEQASFIPQINKSIDQTEPWMEFDTKALELDYQQARDMFIKGFDIYLNDKVLADIYPACLLSGIYKKDIFDKVGSYSPVISVWSLATYKTHLHKRMNYIVWFQYDIDSLNWSTLYPLESKMKMLDWFIFIDEVSRWRDQYIQSSFEWLVLANYDQAVRKKGRTTKSNGIKVNAFQNKSSLLMCWESTLWDSVDAATLNRMIILNIASHTKTREWSVNKLDLSHRMNLAENCRKSFFRFVLNKNTHSMNLDRRFDLANGLSLYAGTEKWSRIQWKLCQILFGLTFLYEDQEVLKKKAKAILAYLHKWDEKAKANTVTVENVVNYMLNNIWVFFDFHDYIENKHMVEIYATREWFRFSPSYIVDKFWSKHNFQSSKGKWNLRHALSNYLETTQAVKPGSFFGSNSNDTKKHFTKITDKSPKIVKQLYNQVIRHSQSLSKMYDDFKRLEHNKYKSKYKEKEEHINEISRLPIISIEESKLWSEDVENDEKQEAHTL